MKKNTIFSYSYVIIAYILAIYAGKLSLDHIQTSSEIVNMLIADVIATVIIFIFSLMSGNSSVYDPYWSLIPVPIALYWIYLFPEGNHIRHIFMLVAISIWSLRLTINWIKSWPNLMHQDWRYKKLAEDSGRLYWIVSFSGIHLFPTLFVFLGMLPVFVASKMTAATGVFDILGLIICLAAVGIEYLSDEQLRKFKSSNPIKGANMEKGLWAISRHPNYFGEILFWFGLFFFAIGDQFRENGWTAVGFISMIILFKFISIPMMEKRLVKTKTDYEKYQKRVSALIPIKF
jgi:steroid 5-alpha reductase family enzyme